MNGVDGAATTWRCQREVILSAGAIGSPFILQHSGVGDAAYLLSLGIKPVGQSGVLFNAHYSDQALRYMAGTYVRQWLKPEDVAANTRNTLVLAPAR